MKLSNLQGRLIVEGLDGLYVTRNDMFLGQDILEKDNKILELTGFSGSYGHLLVMQDICLLLTDSRYEIQARQEVDTNIVEVFTSRENFYAKIESILLENGLKIGYNPWTISCSQNETYHNENIEYVESNIIDIFSEHKSKHIIELDTKFTGFSRDDKIEFVKIFMKQNNISRYLITAADSVSWLTNLRSDYVTTSPVVRAFAMIETDGSFMMFSDDNIDIEGISVYPLKELEKQIGKNDNKIYTDYASTPLMVLNSAKKIGVEIENFEDVCQYMKAEKNVVELANFANAHIKDGVAVTKFLYWLENNWRNKTELDIVSKLYKFRQEQDGFLANSFDTIAGFAENGAIVHYHPTTNSNKTFDRASLLLLDSGGHYLEGTTDITRTIALGEPLKEMIEDYTIVLKSHIALASKTFNRGTDGRDLNLVAKQVMWDYGKNYEHGTGHGVGYVMNVHEGPQGINSLGGEFYENMITSIEPGCYKENEYGIRIENLYETVGSAEEGTFSFESLTYVPLDKRLIDFSMLSKNEKAWLEEYHNDVFANISPYLSIEENKWLEEFTRI